MLLRLVIDVLKGRVELSDQPSAGPAQGSVLEVKLNRFIPADFVFRCKVIERL
jgi:hypothetical protein